MDDDLDLYEIIAKGFIDHCKDKLGWEDLSNDVIMDVGCGEDGFCCKTILEIFPDVGTIICIDSNPRVASNFKLRTTTKIECVIADIEKRESIRDYEAEITKVISTNAFHQLMEKEEAFRNVYRLLKPGGEAAVLFAIESSLYEWLTELLKNPTWEEAYQCHYVEDMYQTGFGTAQYKEMVEKIGFQVIESSEKQRVSSFSSDQDCKELLYDMCGEKFKLPPELLEEFKEECYQVLLKLNPRDAKGKPCYRATELSLLLVKPKEGADSETKENLAI